MKDLKTQFEQYQSPTDEAGWEAVSRDPKVVRYNKGRFVRRIVGYSLGGLTTVAAITAVVLVNTIGDRHTDVAATPSEPTPVTQEIAPATPAQVIHAVQSAQFRETNTAPVAPAIQTENNSLPVANTPETEPVVAVAPTHNNIPTAPVTFNMQPKSGSSTVQPLMPASTEIPNISKPAQHSEEMVADIVTGNAPTEPVKSAKNNEIPYSFWAPNAFSPNGDGNNEKFYVFPDTVTHAKIDVSTYELNVFSRNGQLVFHTRDLNEGWDGSIQNSGNVLSPGVYIYTIRFKLKDGSPKYQKGTITLLK
jgi:gliding motility-associated-like protein